MRLSIFPGGEALGFSASIPDRERDLFSLTTRPEEYSIQRSTFDAQHSAFKGLVFSVYAK